MRKIAAVMVLSALATAHAEVVHWLSQPGEELGLVNNAGMYAPKLSANGQHLCFMSLASNLLAGDENHLADVFAIDLQDFTTEMVSITQGGVQAHDYGTGQCATPSSDGRYIGFVSFSADLPNGVGFADDHFYIKDLQTGALVNHTDDGVGGYFELTGDFFMHENANELIFETYYGLDPLHTGFDKQVYHKQLDTDALELLSKSHDGLAVADEDVTLLDVSDNFRFVLMRSRASNLTTDVINNSDYNLFLLDRNTGIMELVNRTPAGASTSTGAYFNSAAVSNLGEVVFMSDEDELVVGDNNGSSDVFYYDGSQIVRINLDGSGAEVSDAEPGFVDISGDGSRIVFTDLSTDMIGLSTPAFFNLYAYQVNTQTLSLVSRSGGPTAGSNGHTGQPHLSTNGSRVVYTSAATNLLSQPQMGLYDNVYLHSFTLNQTIAPVQPTLPVNTVVSNAVFPSSSSDQRYVIYVSKTNNFTPQAIDDVSGDLYLLDREDNSHTLLALNAWGRTDVSPSGRYVVFRSNYFQPGGVIDLGVNQLFLLDRQTGDYTQLVNSYDFSVNDDGLVAFETEDALVGNDTNGLDDIYTYSPHTGLFTLISEGMGGTAVVGVQPWIGGSGANIWIAFASASDDLVNGDGNGLTDVFVRKWPTGPTVRASQTAAGVEGNGGSYGAKISSNGEYVAFLTEADNLTGDDYSNAGSTQMLRFNRLTLGLELVSRNEFGAPLLSDSPELYELSLSDSGRYVTYAYTDDFAAVDFTGDDDYRKDVVLYDAQTQQAQVISKMPNGSNIKNPSDWSEVVEDLSLSPPRVAVVFQSGHDLTEVSNHPAYTEVFMYQDGGPPFNLSLAVVGPGSISGTGGINCNSACVVQRALGSELTMVAVPDGDAVFSGWTLDFGDCNDEVNPCVLLMDRDKTLVATFKGNDDVIFINSFD